MAKVKDKISGIETVGELITALEEFPRDMPVQLPLHGMLQVYRLEPQEGETWYDDRGAICIEEDESDDDD